MPARVYDSAQNNPQPRRGWLNLWRPPSAVQLRALAHRRGRARRLASVARNPMKNVAKASRSRKLTEPAGQRRSALSSWDNEGGAEPGHAMQNAVAGDEPPATVPADCVELAQLHMRVIALEHLVITLLAQASDEQRDFARRMAACITPRPGFTQHPLTIQAAAQMIHLVHRGSHFRSAAHPD